MKNVNWSYQHANIASVERNFDKGCFYAPFVSRDS